MTNPHDKAIEAAAEALLAAEWEAAGAMPEDAAMIASSIMGGISDDSADDARIARLAARAAIAAYERAMWRAVRECPDEWKDGRPLLAERAFDGNYKTDLPTYFEVRWRTDGFNFTGFMDFQGRRINATRVRPLPPVPEGE